MEIQDTIDVRNRNYTATSLQSESDGSRLAISISLHSELEWFTTCHFSQLYAAILVSCKLYLHLEHVRL
jgi:hypothetical protein